MCTVAASADFEYDSWEKALFLLQSSDSLTPASVADLFGAVFESAECNWFPAASSPHWMELAEVEVDVELGAVFTAWDSSKGIISMRESDVKGRAA